MDPKPQKPFFPFASPFSLWTELAFKLWGFGKPPSRSDTTEKQVAVAVIPTSDAQSAAPAKTARTHSNAKRGKGKVRIKSKSKRVRR